jgi:hypothetical protein
MLPEIRPSAEIYGEARGQLAGVPVAAALGDQQAALFGQTCFSPGDAKCTYGTGSFLLMNTGGRPVLSSRGLLTTVACRVGDEAPTYALEGSIAVTGALVQWFRDNLTLIGSAPELETLARTVDDNGGCYFVPAFSGLFAPAFAQRCAGRDRRPDRLHHQGAPGPRRARSHRVADARGRRGDDLRRRRVAQHPVLCWRAVVRRRASGRASKPPLLRPAGAGLCWQGLAFAPAGRDARSAAAGAHAGSRASMRSGRGHRRQDDLAGVALLQFDQIVDVLDNPRGSGICRNVRLHRGLPVRHRDKPGPGLDELIGLKSRPPAKDLQQPPRSLDLTDHFVERPRSQRVEGDARMHDLVLSVRRELP